MPPSVSNLSLKLLEQVRLHPDELEKSDFPVYIDSRLITGFFPALEMKRLISEREDLSYIGKVNRNVDQGSVPGFSFVREGAESLNEYIKMVQTRPKAA
jgi:hypothetical protein